MSNILPKFSHARKKPPPPVLCSKSPSLDRIKLRDFGEPFGSASFE